MSELRKDPVSNQWTVIAPELLDDLCFDVRRVEPEKRGTFCPFCPGNESSTPPEVMVIGPDGREPDGQEWSVRVFPSRSPALHTEYTSQRLGKGMYDYMDSLGAHEVVVHSPDHEAHIAALSENQISSILWAYRERIRDLYQDFRLEYVMVFSDRNKSVSTDLSHPYSQIVAMPNIPEAVKAELRGAKHYYELKERCVFCDIIRQESADEVRIVAETDGYIALCPFASRFPYEVWILPTKHELDFTGQSEEHLRSLAKLVKVIAGRMDEILDGVEYNFVLHTGPNLRTQPDLWQTIRDDYHWHIEFTPRTSHLSGLEWEPEVHVNAVSPEAAAEALRTTH